MSTILKALRRLEADATPEAREEGVGAPSLPATDPRAADELRDRILAEEAAAGIQNSADRVRRRARPLVLGSLAACLIIAAGVSGYYLTRPGSSPDPPLAADAADAPKAARSGSSAAVPAPARPVPAPVAALPVVAAAESHLAQAAPNAAGATAAAPRRGVPIGVPIESLPMLSGKAAHDAPDQPRRERNAVPIVGVAPTSAAAKVASAFPALPALPALPAKPVVPETQARSSEAEAAPMPVAAVVPTRARAAADVASVATPPRASKSIEVSSPAPKPVSKPEAKPVSAAVSKPRVRSAAKTPADAKPVEQVVHQELPGITVVRTAWHPTPERRSARIHLNSTDETLTLHEGDAVGGLIVHEISPSAVVFRSGDVEIRRRVGQP